MSAAAIDASQLLRPGLLEGVSVLIADGVPARSADGGDRESFAQSVRVACAGLGARVTQWEPDAPVADIDTLLIDCASPFAERPSAGAEGERTGPGTPLHACLDGAWSVTQAVANAAFLEPGRPGRIVFLAPAPAPAPTPAYASASASAPAARATPGSELARHADAARAGLENLARTLSIEWARHAITTVAIAPGADTSGGEVAALSAYLASPAGAYFSGCLLDLRGPTGA